MVMKDEDMVMNWWFDEGQLWWMMMMMKIEEGDDAVNEGILRAEAAAAIRFTNLN